ncbi:hypothetical protein [Actinoplanes sp. GCM10030250]|uniref:Rv1733c family protein n=1 Tax=Actinoplanes sp. GCM10030250 TaxID=3273376 RepID=UPI00360F52C7
MGNPLRRRSDRIESAMMLTLLLLFLLAGPLLGWWAARSSYLTDRQAQEWERIHVHRTEAQLTGEPETLGMGESRTVAPRAARATWQAPDGTPRTGIVQVTTTAKSGDRIVIWVDDRGVLRGAPQVRDPVPQAVLVAAAVLLCLAAALTGIRAIGRTLLDRRRDLAWQHEWQQVGPEWSRDRR